MLISFTYAFKTFNKCFICRISQYANMQTLFGRICWWILSETVFVYKGENKHTGNVLIFFVSNYS